MNLTVWADRNGVVPVPSVDQRVDLNRHVARIAAGTTVEQMSVQTVITEVVSALNAETADRRVA